MRLYDYVPAPKPVTTDRIVAAHYYPSWKRGAAGLHNGFDDLHEYPERTPLVGYYDGDSPVLADWEIKWALEHGINCFIYCWYRKKNNMGLPVTQEALRLGESLHEGFLKARYSKMMQFAIMFEVQNTWGAAADLADLTEHLMPFWIEEYFSKENYLKINNCPVLFVYDYQDQLLNCLGGPEGQRKAFDACREIARQHGFDGMIFSVEYRKNDLSRLEDYRASGYDFSFAYAWSIKDPGLTDEQILSAQLERMKARLASYGDFFVPTASSMWDPSPRFISMPQMYPRERNPLLWKLSPEDYRRLLRSIKEMTDALDGDCIARKMVMLDNWNEWDEGHYLAPGVEFGFGYLQAVREEYTLRDNLPDYRLPDVIGTGGVNTQWAEPDFTDVPAHPKN
ncbi:MAG: glycoside hydrolase family 99-like domain-containing protein [Clostridia bacterium]|nr:glycoside hydrolase family 99-like domain-containing protein [Clostridia bacterium]